MGSPLSTNSGPITFSGITISHGTSAIANVYEALCSPTSEELCPRGWPVTISRSIISDSSDSAVFNRGHLTISESTLTRNGNSYSLGGALHNVGTLRIVNSTISGNRAETGAGFITVAAM